jgi:hypothetical protein
VLLVRVSSCDERLQGVFSGVVGENAQRELEVVVGCSVAAGYRSVLSGGISPGLMMHGLLAAEDLRVKHATQPFRALITAVTASV